MDTEQACIAKFLTVCTELVEGKYADADLKISEALRAIAESKRLTELFTAVTQEFDYAWAKRTYLRYPVREGSSKGEMYLPAGRSEVLAFVFCLFVEIDAGAVKLNDFILRYCYVDGSYTASYSMFAERVVRPFRDIVGDCFPEAKRAVRGGGRSEELAEITRLIEGEKIRLAPFGLREEEWQASQSLLSASASAIQKGEIGELTALLAGYRYLLRYINGENEDSAELFERASKL